MDHGAVVVSGRGYYSASRGATGDRGPDRHRLSRQIRGPKMAVVFPDAVLSASGDCVFGDSGCLLGAYLAASAGIRGGGRGHGVAAGYAAGAGGYVADWRLDAGLPANVADDQRGARRRSV